ncbi:MAG: TetR/AcrR family transcriptional regulator [Thermodesulfobacteriota bacterium]|nr:TetR/AcrR family transcriptional regulator [Thermodesulfobacteriota bacterium]
MDTELTPRQTFFNLPPDKQQRVLEAAVQEFSERGYQQASINTIVSRLNIAKGSIYQYFDSKKSLFLFIFNQGIAMVRQMLKQVKKESQGEDFFTRVRKSLMAGVEFIDKHPALYRVYLRILFERDSPLREDFLQTIRLFSREYILSLLEEGQARGEVRKDLDPVLAVFILDAVLDKFLQNYALPYLDPALELNEKKGLEEKIDSIVTMLRQGFAAADGI